jgi:LacI family transcriptional regulator
MTLAAPTLAQVAVAAGVSAMTVSRALNRRPGVSSSLRESIVKLATEMGYESSRAARQATGEGRVLGVLADHLDQPFISHLVTGVVGAASATGNEVLIYSLADRQRRPPAKVLKLLQQFTDGVIALPPPAAGFVAALSEGRYPLVTIDNPAEPCTHPTVAADSYGGARAAMHHLAELGHRRVAFVTGAEQLASAHQRRRAYDDAVPVLGLAREPGLVIPGDYTLAGGRRAGERLLKLKHRPTAVFASNDLSAFGLMAVLQESGLKIPDDMSVVGFDDLPAACQIHPMLTTVRQPIEDLGRAAVHTLLALIAGLPAAATQVILPTELVVRQSTRAPRR